MAKHPSIQITYRDGGESTRRVRATFENGQPTPEEVGAAAHGALRAAWSALGGGESWDRVWNGFRAAQGGDPGG